MGMGFIVTVIIFVIIVASEAKKIRLCAPLCPNSVNLLLFQKKIHQLAYSTFPFRNIPPILHFFLLPSFAPSPESTICTSQFSNASLFRRAASSESQG